MTPTELRALADTLRRIVPRPEQDHLDAGDALERAADYLHQCADAVPVGTLAISTFRGRSEKQNRDFDYTGGLPDGSYSLYTAPMPAAPQELAPQELAQLAPPKREPCIGNDPACPCQDGDACHYKDAGGTKAWPVPQAEPTEAQITAAAKELCQCHAEGCGVDPDDTWKVYCDQFRTEATRVLRAAFAHGIGGSDGEE